MTEWYSPKDKLPKIEDYTSDGKPSSSIWIYAALIEKNKEPVYLDAYYYYEKSIWVTHDSLLMPEPQYWCYFPTPPQELIDKLKEKNNVD